MGLQTIANDKEFAAGELAAEIFVRVPADCDHRFQLIATGRSD